MATQLERRLRDFVDRVDEMEAFCRMLDDREHPVMVVWGPGGIGKSSLIARMMHEVALRNAQRAEVIYTDDNIPDYLAVMRKSRDDLGVEGFGELTDLINYFTDPQYTLNVNVSGAANVSVGANMNAQGAVINEMAGIVIRDVMIAQPRNDLGVTESERRSRLTKTFIDALAARGNRLLVVFFDAVEKMTTSTHTWLWDQLITGVTDAGLAHVRFVICGRTEPPINRYMRQLVVMSELKPLAVSDVAEYLARRGIPEGERTIVAQTLHRLFKGNPFEIANAVDNLLGPTTS